MNTARIRKPLIASVAAIAALVGTAGTAAAAPAGATRTVPAHQCRHQHIDRNAPVISHADVFIAASPRAVWKIHTDVDDWPTWKSDVPYAYRLDNGALRVGSKFRWSNGGLAITSKVRALRPDRCTLWAGPAAGIQGLHLWTFTPVTDGTLVHTEESWSGAPVDADPAKAQAVLDQGLAQGVADLKAAAESGVDADTTGH